MLLDIQSSADIHTQNLLKIIMLTIEKGHTHRKELARELSLSAGTVSALCNKLVLLGLATEAKQSVQPYGAKVKMLSMNREKYCLAMLDIHQIQTAQLHILSLDGERLCTRSFAIVSSAEDFLAGFADIYSAESQKYRQAGIEIIGMGVAVSATMHKKSGKLVTAAAPVFEGIPLQERLQQACCVPVVVENESVLCSIASIIKHGSESKRSIYLFIDEGTGVGVVLQNNIIVGDNGLGSDINNILSPYAPGRQTVEQVLSSHSNQSGRVKGQTFGYLLSILINLLDINTFYVGGDFARQIAARLPEIDAVLDELVLHRELRDILIIPDPLYAETMRYGAVAIVMPEVIKKLSSTPLTEQAGQ